MTRFQDKVCVVTGAAKGIGEATARRLASEGGAVMLLDLKYEETLAAADRLNAELAEAHGFAEAYACDVSSEENVRRVFSEIERHHGRVDVLVNNAGIVGPAGPLETLTLNGWNRLLGVNLTGAFLCTREAVRLMKLVGGGAVVNVSSIAGLVGSPGIAPYTASKGGLRLLTKTTALEGAPFGIRVNSVHPGAILTPMVEGFAEGGRATPTRRCTTSSASTRWADWGALRRWRA
ncbi:SDR family NAD(P)-dependent oxidoreductase [Deinococcus planocerae]|uniref:SDR family NAD(P)-dependent oxidoreductase n=1 Tax=Deinococcus planocerae TaxID=1737569 RepID=UPI001C63FECB|nr:SDR family oxidoreductase [Deinococcus planocerae]